MMTRQGLFAAWIAMCGFVFCGCTIETVDDEQDETSDDDSSAQADDDSGGGGVGGQADDGSSNEADDDAGAGGAGEAGGAGGTSGVDAAGQGGSGEANQAGSAGVENAAQSDLAQIEGATFIEGGRPDTTPGSQAGPEVDAPQYVINGGTGQYTISIADGDAFILIGIEGDNGYYKVPVTLTDSQTVAITLLQDYDLDTLGVLVATVDEEGDVSAWTSNTAEVVETAAGDLKVSLSFNQAEDLDLWVTDPSGAVINYSSPSANGGQLDLDSNSACNGNLGVNNENITWEGSEVLRGEYTVQVDYYEQCSAASVDYIVTVSIGESVKTYTGSFEGTEGGSAMDTVTTFTY